MITDVITQSEGQVTNISLNNKIPNATTRHIHLRQISHHNHSDYVFRRNTGGGPQDGVVVRWITPAGGSQPRFVPGVLKLAGQNIVNLKTCHAAGFLVELF